eukprot:TRINITY_DN2841_c0_g1_i1.p1 TRINITY_DN2841_c0_g1~~TRINITY_DN2841_c0_g1_i1.p1  ORF type:complete len:1374 (+),score=325.14 TRINITY_DN2841_c0_g1_i1:76-4197(+)
MLRLVMIGARPQVRGVRAMHKWLIPKEAYDEYNKVMVEMMDMERYPEFRYPFTGQISSLQDSILEACEGLDDDEWWSVWVANEQPGHRSQIKLIRNRDMVHGLKLSEKWVTKVFNDIKENGDVAYSLGEGTERLVAFFKHLQERGVQLSDLIPVSRRLDDILVELATSHTNVRIHAGRPPYYGVLSKAELNTIKSTIEFSELDEKALPMTALQLTWITKTLTGEEGTKIYDSSKSNTFISWLATAYHTLVKDDPYVKNMRIPDYGGWDREVIEVTRGLDEAQADKYMTLPLVFNEVNSKEHGYFRAVLNRLVKSRKDGVSPTGPVTEAELAAGWRDVNPPVRLPGMFLTNQEYKKVLAIRAKHNFYCDIETALDDEYLPATLRQIKTGVFSDHHLWEYIHTMQALSKIPPPLRLHRLGPHGENLMTAIKKMMPFDLPEATPTANNEERTLRGEIYATLMDVYLGSAKPDRVPVIPDERLRKLDFKPKAVSTAKSASVSADAKVLKMYKRLPMIEVEPHEGLLGIVNDPNIEKERKLRVIEAEGYPGTVSELQKILQGDHLGKSPEAHTRRVADYFAQLDRDVNTNKRENHYGPHEEELKRMISSATDIMHLITTAKRSGLVSELTRRLHVIASRIIRGDYSRWDQEVAILLEDFKRSAKVDNLPGSMRPPLLGLPKPEIVKMIRRASGTAAEKKIMHLSILDELRLPGQPNQYRDNEVYANPSRFVTWWRWLVGEIASSAHDDYRRKNVIRLIGKYGKILSEMVVELLKRHTPAELRAPTSTQAISLVYEAVTKVLSGEWQPTKVDLHVSGHSSFVHTSASYMSLGRSINRIPAVGKHSLLLKIILMHVNTSHSITAAMQALDQYGLPGSISQTENYEEDFDPEPFQKWLIDICKYVHCDELDMPYILGLWERQIMATLRAMNLTHEEVSQWEPSMFGHVYNVLLDVLKGNEVAQEDLQPKDDVPYVVDRPLLIPFDLPLVSPGTTVGPPQEVLDGCVEFMRLTDSLKKPVAVQAFVMGHMGMFMSKDQASEVVRYLAAGQPETFNWRDNWSLEKAIDTVVVQSNRQRRAAPFINSKVKEVIVNVNQANRFESRQGWKRNTAVEPAINYAWYLKFQRLLRGDDVETHLTDEEISDARDILTKNETVGYLRMPFTRPFRPGMAEIIQSRMFSPDKKLMMLEEANFPGTKSQLHRFVRTSYAQHNFRSDFRAWLKRVLDEFFPKPDPAEDAQEVKKPKIHLGVRQDPLLETIGTLDIEAVRNLGSTHEDNLTFIRLYNVLADVLLTGKARNAFAEVHVTGRFNVSETIRSWLTSACPRVSADQLDRAVGHYEVLISKNQGAPPFHEGSIEDEVVRGLRALRMHEAEGGPVRLVSI